MRYVYCLLMLMMISCVAVQYDDPDGLLWGAIYMVPAVWCALAAFCRQCLLNIVTQSMLVLCMLTAFAGVVWYWPSSPQFWRSSIWYESETAREGMGMMIVAIVLLLVWCATRQSREHHAQ